MMESVMLDFVAEASSKLLDFVTGIQFLFSPVILLGSFAIASAYWFLRSSDKPFLAWLLPRELYSHPSTRTDFKLNVVNIVLIGTGAISAFVLTPTIAVLITDLLGGTLYPAENSNIRVISCILVFVLIADLTKFLQHYWHHFSPVFWPFHSVHHSAEVLTPVSFFRAHPFYYVVQQLMLSATIGASIAVMTVFVLGPVPIWAFGAAAAVPFLYHVFGVHLRHSHIPIGYGRALEHILISPRMHQLHHSRDPAHFNRNFGYIFALWDWMFGTLCIPGPGETFEFGLVDEEGRSMQPHPGLRLALIEPFCKSGSVIVEKFSERPGEAVEHISRN